jgi:predicted metal-dependent peptidase
MGELVVAVDTSGSITNPMLAAFSAELTAILHEAMPERVTVIYCDAAVRGTEEFLPDDPEVKLKMKGGGGTAFIPVFRHVEKHGLNPVCLIYLTDLESSDKPKEPEYPTLWATPEWVNANGPFGDTLRIAGI